MCQVAESFWNWAQSMALFCAKFQKERTVYVDVFTDELDFIRFETSIWNHGSNLKMSLKCLFPRILLVKVLSYNSLCRFINWKHSVRSFHQHLDQQLVVYDTSLKEIIFVTSWRKYGTVNRVCVPVNVVWLISPIACFLGWDALNSLRPSDAICVSTLTIIGSDNGLSPGRHQAIIWTNAGML